MALVLCDAKKAEPSIFIKTADALHLLIFVKLVGLIPDLASFRIQVYSGVMETVAGVLKLSSFESAWVVNDLQTLY